MAPQPIAYAMYRLPEHHRYVYMAQTQGLPEQISDLADLNDKHGFLMAPFEPSPAHAIWLMHPDLVEEHDVAPADHLAYADVAPLPRSEEQAAYARCFDRFHEQVAGRRFRKLVLSRATKATYPDGATPKELFLRACRLYPHQMIALVAMPHVGTWLMATPEVLLQGDGNEWQTMALAGTMPMQQHDTDISQTAWSSKNRAEQTAVTSYIHDLLARYATTVDTHGPYTVQAAHLLHLRTDFRFRLRSSLQLGSLLSDLYPTPAVCGLPKAAARQWIIEHEGVDRRYYSGFCGPYDPHGATHLYVSLRCMELLPQAPTLYAGGGILPGSTMQQEWLETEAKLHTMRRLLE